MLFTFVAIATTDDERIAKAKLAVQDQLTDPESARFKDVVVRSADKFVAVCGQFNAKNRYGGYAGFRRFMVTEFKADKSGAVDVEPPPPGVDRGRPSDVLDQAAPRLFEMSWRHRCGG